MHVWMCHDPDCPRCSGGREEYSGRPEGRCTSSQHECDLRVEEKRVEWLAGEYLDLFREIHNAVERLHEEHKTIPQLKFFTPHNMSHCLAVEELIYRLIPSPRHWRMTAYERFLLLSTAWLHDVGMIRGLLESDGRLGDAALRFEHHNRSEMFIVNCHTRCGVTPHDAAVLGLLSRAHGVPIESIDEVKTFRNQRVHVRLLAAYLCLADALHVDSSRAPADDYAICLAYDVPTRTKIHWLKSRFVSGIDIDAERRAITVEFKVPTPAQERDLRRQGVMPSGVSRIHNVVMGELARSIRTVQNPLMKGGITWFLDLNRSETPMSLDRQVMLDLRLVINNPDFLANPSSSRLYELLLLMAADIIDISDQLSPTPHDAEAYWRKDDGGAGEQDDCRLRATLPDARKRLAVAIEEFDDGVLKERNCHLALRKLVDQLRAAIKESEAAERRRDLCTPSPEGTGGRGTDAGDIPPTGGPNPSPGGGPQLSVKAEPTAGDSGAGETKTRPADRGDGPASPDLDPIIACVQSAYRRFHSQRNAIRVKAKLYFAALLDNKEILDRPLHIKNETDILSWNHPVTILLFGYSELVIKALCGMRDGIVDVLLRASLDLQPLEPPSGLPQSARWVWKRLKAPYHKARFEELASDHIRLFVCQGMAKSQTTTGGRLGYHDGHHYASKLGEHGFTNILIIPDAAAPHLLHRRRWDPGTGPGTAPGTKTKESQSGDGEDKKDAPFVDFVMVGTNGVTNTHFRHSGGHLHLATSVASVRRLELEREKDSRRFVRLPRLVLVTTSGKKYSPKGQVRDKHHPHEHVWTYRGHCQHGDDEGYTIQYAFAGETVRKKAFLEHDPLMKQDFHDYGVRLYNPREDVIPLALVNDMIHEEGFFIQLPPDRKAPSKIIDQSGDGPSESLPPQTGSETLSGIIDGWPGGEGE